MPHTVRERIWSTTCGCSPIRTTCARARERRVAPESLEDMVDAHHTAGVGQAAASVHERPYLLTLATAETRCSRRSPAANSTCFGAYL